MGGNGVLGLVDTHPYKRYNGCEVIDVKDVIEKLREYCEALLGVMVVLYLLAVVFWMCQLA